MNSQPPGPKPNHIEAMPVRIVGARPWHKDAVSYTAAVVAIAALGVSFWQGYASHKHNLLTVRPLLLAYADFTVAREDAGLIIQNRGTGPAIVSATALSLGGHHLGTISRNGWLEALRRGGISSKMSTITWSIEPGFVIDTDNPVVLIRPSTSASVEDLSQLGTFVKSRLHADVWYCSLYEQCWRMTYRNNATTNVDAICPAAR